MKWIAGVLLAVALTGCGAAPEAAPARTSSTPSASSAAPAPTTAAPSPTAPSPTVPTPTAPTASPSAPAAPAAIDLDGAELPQFDAADGQITCLFDSTGGAQVRCDVMAAHWKVSTPSSCMDAYGDSVMLRDTPSLTCHGDTIFSPDVTLTLAPGKAARYRGLVCSATATSVSCSTSAGRGFMVSKPAYSLS